MSVPRPIWSWICVGFGINPLDTWLRLTVVIMRARNLPRFRIVTHWLLRSSIKTKIWRKGASMAVPISVPDHWKDSMKTPSLLVSVCRFPSGGGISVAKPRR